MNDLNKLKGLENQEPLFDKHALEQHILTAQPKQKLSKFTNRRIIMTFSSIAILGTALILTFFGQDDNKQEQPKQETKTETISIFEEKKTPKEKSQLTIYTVEEESAGTATTTNVLIDKKEDDKKKEADLFNTKSAEGFTFDILRSEEDPNTVKKPPLQKEEILNDFNIQAMKMIEFTTEEIEKLNIQVEEDYILIHRERYFTSVTSDYVRQELRKRGYDVDNPPFFTKYSDSISIYGESVSPYDAYQYTGWSIDDYSRTHHVAIHSLGEGNRITSWNVENNLPLLVLDKEKYSQFNKKIIDLRKTDYSLYRSNKEEWKLKRDSFFLEERKIENELYKHLVPIYYKPDNPKFNKFAFIFWYIPNEEFLNAIPKKYADQIRLELEAMRKHEELGIPLHEACRGIDNTNSIYGLCRLTSGTINLTRLSPNPAETQMSCEFDLDEERTVTINIHDINGRFVGNVVKEKKFGTGINTVDIDLSKYSSNQFYLLSVTTNKGEVVSQRFYMK